MAAVLGFETGVSLPSLSGMFSGWGTWLIIGIIVITFGLSLIGVIWWYNSRKVFNIKIRDFENISGQGFQLVFRDVARLVKIGNGGEELLYLKKRKQYRTAYGKKMGKNEYWFSKGQDGYWYNCVLGDLDAKMGMLDIEPIDRDMRYMHVAIRKNIEDRYQKKKMEKIVAYTIVGVVIVSLILMIGGYFIVKQMSSASSLTNENIKAVKPVADALEKAVGHLDTLCSGGSGIS